MQRGKNKLVRAERTAKAAAVFARIGKEIKQWNKVRLNHIEGKTDAT